MAKKKTSTKQVPRKATRKTVRKKPARSSSATRSKPSAKKLKVLFVSPECAPYAKVGGLADVVGALPKTLRRMGHDVRILLPLYSSIDRDKHGIVLESSACVHMGGGKENWIGVHKAMLDGDVPVWFVDYADFFARPGIYDGLAGEYKDNAFRFSLFAKAALQVCKDRHFTPDVIHIHDWPAAPVAAFLKTWDRILSPLSKTASVLTIHNIGYQGVYDAAVFPYIGVGAEHYHSRAFEDHGHVNLLKAGIHFADAITTVSPTHAHEITKPAGGHGLAMYLNDRSKDFFGILNGADYDEWNPANDPFLPATYNRRSLAGKSICKAELQRRMGLEVRGDVPVFGIISRFAPQKGFGLVSDAIPVALGEMDFQLAVLGTGDPATENLFRSLALSYPGRVGCHVGFSVELSHLIEAGSDFFLMPSLYEPCGLNQMYSMKYATIPIVRSTGGLEDTVTNYNEGTGEGTGFKFYQPMAVALRNTMGWAVSTWFDRPAHMAKLRRQAMAADFSWDRSAKEYLAVYKHAIRNRRAQPALRM